MGLFSHIAMTPAKRAGEGHVRTLHRALVRGEVCELLKEKSERQQDVHHLSAVARLLHVGDPAVAPQLA
jgi:hypothetical protein